MKKLAKYLVGTISLLTLFSSLVGCGGKSEKNVIVIGGMGPLTGPASVYGQAVYNSAKMAIDEINAAGGLENGLKLQLEFLDDAHDATKVANNYLDLFENKGMQVSIGTVTTAPCQEFKKLSKDDNVFFMTPSASNDTIVEYSNGYQMCFADGKQGAYSATFVNENYAGQTIGVFYKADDDYSKGIWDQFKAKLDKTITVVETSFTGDGTDFSTQVKTLSDANVEFVFMPIYYTPASLFMMQGTAKFSASTVFFGCDGFDGIESMDGFKLSSIKQEVSMLSHFDSSATTGKAGEFITKYKATYGAETLNQFGASAYDCVYAIAKALNEIEKANPGTVTASAKASDLCNALNALIQGGFEYTGVTGAEGTAITWDKDGYVNKVAVKFTLKAADKPE